MAPDPKFAKAYKAMRALSYANHIVKPVLKNLLVVYDQNWQYIEDGNYSVLVDAILQREECKENEQQKFHLIDELEEDEPPWKRSRLRSQTVETLSSGDFSPSSNGTTDKLFHHIENVLSESNAKKIESVYVCLFDNERETEVLSSVPHCQGEVKNSTPNSSLGSIPKGKIQMLSHGKRNVSDPLSPGKQSNDNGDTYTSCSIVPSMITESGKHTVSWEEKNAVSDSILSKQKDMLNKNYSDVAGEIELLPGRPSDFEVPLTVVPPDNVKWSTEGNSFNAKELVLSSPEVINTIEDTPALCLCCEDASSNGNCSLLQGHCLESSAATKEEDSSSNSSRIDIASSSRGEVKLSVTYESSILSNICVPSLDAVLKWMEEKLIKSYVITHPGFFLMNLMKDICGGFLEVGTNATHDEGVGSGDVHTYTVVPKDSDTRDVANENVNLQVGFCVAPNISMGTVQLQILTKVLPQIPKFQSLNFLELSRCKINLTMKGSYGERNKNILPPGELKNSTSSSMVIIQKQHFPQDMLSSAYHIDDFTRGEEDLEISLINEVNNEHRPMFMYIPRNITYQSAYVKFLLARLSDENCCSNCSGDCLSSEIPCACAGETGGEFAYMPGGVLKEKFLEDCILMNCNPQQKNLSIVKRVH